MSSRSVSILALLIGLAGCSSDANPMAGGAIATAGTGAATPPAPASTAGSPSPGAAAGAGARATTPTPTATAGKPAATSGGAGAASPSATAGAAAPDGPTVTAGTGAAGSGASTAAGGGATAGTGATVTAGTGAAGGGAPAMHEDLGMGDGSDVVTVGDSWMSLITNGGGIEAGLRAASMQPYRNYGVAGTMLLDEVIPNQYESAKRQNPDIKTVVMTGGGNDLLLTGMTAGGCGDGCMMTIDRVTDRLKKMWDEMAADGVQDIVYIEYSRGGTNEPGVSYANEVIPPVCAAAPTRCHFIDSDLIINKVLLDGVHPTADGCAKIGQAVFDLMVEKGMRR